MNITGGAAEKGNGNTWLIKVDKASPVTIAAEGNTIATLDFTGATLEEKPAEEPAAKVVPISLIPQDEDIEGLNKKASELVSADTAIAEDGSVTGTLKYIASWAEWGASTPGHYIPVRLNDTYEGKPITVTGKSAKTDTDRDWILSVENNDSTFKFEADGAVILTLTFKGATFAEA